MTAPALRLHNGESAALDALPRLSADAFRAEVLALVAGGARIASWFILPRAPQTDADLVAVLACDDAGDYALLATEAGTAYPSLTLECPQAHLFERELFEAHGIRPLGHPWLKPVRFPSGAKVCEMPFYRMEGDDIHEVAVGPVHAGVIEPGHFRFSCEGETVHHLEIALGYQHRGVERALPGGPDRRTVHLIETAAGDTTAGHAIAYAQACEALAGLRIPARAEQIRGIALELERLANHCGDLGALAGDVGFLPTASFCGRLRGEFLNLTALLCGNRFGRGLVRPGGTGFDIDPARAEQLLGRLETIFADARHAIELLWETPSVMARFERTGVLTREEILDLGIVGVAARAGGVERDARFRHPLGIYARTHLPVSTMETGDVFARAYVRWLEMQRSRGFIRETALRLEPGASAVPCEALKPNRIAVSATEGWRGEILHAAATGPGGRFAAYKIVDPSFHNWKGLAMAMRGEEISDFPLCNKSFNLSYCGQDL